MKPLIPPDLERCQGEDQVGAFVCGGRIGERTRCPDRPTVVIEEREPGKDGRRGSMSLCHRHLTAAREHLRVAFDVTPIKKPRAKRQTHAYNIEVDGGYPKSKRVLVREPSKQDTAVFSSRSAAQQFIQTHTLSGRKPKIIPAVREPNA